LSNDGFDYASQRDTSNNGFDSELQRDPVLSSNDGIDYTMQRDPIAIIRAFTTAVCHSELQP
jgi:hypothetical protein